MKRYVTKSELLSVQTNERRKLAAQKLQKQADIEKERYATVLAERKEQQRYATEKYQRAPVKKISNSNLRNRPNSERSTLSSHHELSINKSPPRPHSVNISTLPKRSNDTSSHYIVKPTFAESKESLVNLTRSKELFIKTLQKYDEQQERLKKQQERLVNEIRSNQQRGNVNNELSISVDSLDEVPGDNVDGKKKSYGCEILAARVKDALPSDSTHSSEISRKRLDLDVLLEQCKNLGDYSAGSGRFNKEVSRNNTSKPSITSPTGMLSPKDKIASVVYTHPSVNGRVEESTRKYSPLIQYMQNQVTSPYLATSQKMSQMNQSEPETAPKNDMMYYVKKLKLEKPQYDGRSNANANQYQSATVKLSEEVINALNAERKENVIKKKVMEIPMPESQNPAVSLNNPLNSNCMMATTSEQTHLDENKCNLLKTKSDYNVQSNGSANNIISNRTPHGCDSVQNKEKLTYLPADENLSKSVAFKAIPGHDVNIAAPQCDVSNSRKVDLRVFGKEESHSKPVTLSQTASVIYKPTFTSTNVDNFKSKHTMKAGLSEIESKNLLCAPSSQTPSNVTLNSNYDEEILKEGDILRAKLQKKSQIPIPANYQSAPMRSILRKSLSFDVKTAVYKRPESAHANMIINQRNATAYKYSMQKDQDFIEQTTPNMSRPKSMSLPSSANRKVRFLGIDDNTVKTSETSNNSITQEDKPIYRSNNWSDSTKVVKQVAMVSPQVRTPTPNSSGTKMDEDRSNPTNTTGNQKEDKTGNREDQNNNQEDVITSKPPHAASGSKINSASKRKNTYQNACGANLGHNTSVMNIVGNASPGSKTYIDIFQARKALLNGENLNNRQYQDTSQLDAVHALVERIEKMNKNFANKGVGVTMQLLNENSQKGEGYQKPQLWNKPSVVQFNSGDRSVVNDGVGLANINNDVDSCSNIKLDKTPTDDDINKLWTSVRSFLSRSQSENDMRNNAHFNNLVSAKNNQHLMAQDHDKLSDVLTVNLLPMSQSEHSFRNKENVNADSFQTKDSKVLHKPPKPVKITMSNLKKGQNQKREYTQMLQRPQRVPFTMSDTRMRDMPNATPLNQVQPDLSNCKEAWNNTNNMTDSLVEFLAAEELCRQDISESSVEKAIDEIRYKQNGYISYNAKSKLSLAEQKLLESISRLDNQLKMTELKLDAPIPDYTSKSPGFRGARPLGRTRPVSFQTSRAHHKY